VWFRFGVLVSGITGGDAAGDGLFFFEVRKQSSKPWVSRLITPYTILFALACAVSFASMAMKSRLLVLKLKSRFAVNEVVTASPRLNRRLSIGGVAISPGLSSALSVSHSDLDTIAELKSKFDEHRMHRHLALCHIASALLEDVPMGKLLPKLLRTVIAEISLCGPNMWRA
jgi:hypothetical protein